MADPPLDARPAERALTAARELGADRLRTWCADLLTGRATYGDPVDPDPGWISGPPARTWGSPERLAVREETSWPRVWAARTLLHVWDESVCSGPTVSAVVDGLTDPAWRVREMCAKVAARGELGAAADAAAALVEQDDVTRVRAAAVRVVGAVGEHEHLEVVLRAQVDREQVVRAAADRALRQLVERLDLDTGQVGPD